MQTLEALLSEIPKCRACGLMCENKFFGIPFVPVIPKPFSKIIFIGRDPSPRTAQSVGLRGGRSVFINEIFNLVDDTGITEDQIYITDLCKCHWRTSAGNKPLPQTENRSPKLNLTIADTCMKMWLIHEVRILHPALIVTFGEELFQLFHKHITYPVPAPKKLSENKAKSVTDAESWFVENGPFSINLDGIEYSFIPMRHPGNTSRLPKMSSNVDRRYEFYQFARVRLIELLNLACF